MTEKYNVKEIERFVKINIRIYNIRNHYHRRLLLIIIIDI